MSKRKKGKQRTKQQKRARRQRRQRTAPAGRIVGQRAKMSEILSELGRPWIDRLGADPDRDWVDLVYTACAAAWNASRVQDTAERRVAFDEATRQIVEPASGELRDEMALMMERTCRRADGWLPGERRRMVSLSVEKRGPGQFYLNVAGLATD